MSDAPEFEEIWDEIELAQAPDWTQEILGRDGGVERWNYSVLRPEGVARDFTVTVYFRLETSRRW